MTKNENIGIPTNNTFQLEKINLILMGESNFVSSKISLAVFDQFLFGFGKKFKFFNLKKFCKIDF